MFILSSLLLNKKKKKKEVEYYPDVTVLIPTYNACKTIIECEESIINTVKSVLEQEYEGQIYIKVIDDGSTDDTIEYLEESLVVADIDEVIEEEHKGKFNALNVGLANVSTKYVITVDNDTVLNKYAVRNIVNEIENSNFVAVAGCLFVKNKDETFITKIQQWDYTIGIFGIKLIQSFYNSVLVAQGAFSIYRTDILKELGGWSNHIGEDIILTWQMLKKGYRTGFSEEAIAFTEVPITFKKLGIQRKRWARGMIEAFKEIRDFFFSKASIKSKFLVFLNVFFPFIDMATLIFLPLGIILLLLGSNLLIGILTLLLIPSGLFLSGLIEKQRRKALIKLVYKLEKRSKLAFVAYCLLYNYLLVPFCLMGYISEFLNLKKHW